MLNCYIAKLLKNDIRKLVSRKLDITMQQYNNRTILHVDLNSFFATSEQQANPYLRGKPVGIIKARARTCVIAASVQAKKFGVRTGTTTYEAKKLCPAIILVEADFDKYADITYRFIKICKTYSPLCEVFSLDECFIDVTESEKFFPRLPRKPNLEESTWMEMGKSLRGVADGGNVFNIAFEIKDRLRAEIGDYMTCSIGVSYNKLLAKLAGEQIKPDGLFWITDDNAIAVLDKSELMDVCGIGWGLSGHLRKLGIGSFPQLRSKSLAFLHKHFGPWWSVHLYNTARGIDGSPVNSFLSLEEAKSVGRTYTTHRNLYKKEEVRRLMRNLCEEAAAKARAMNLAGRYVGVVLRGGEESRYGHFTLKEYIDDGKKFFDLCLQITREWTLPYVRFCGVTLGMLTKSEHLTTPLFPGELRRRKLVAALDAINNRFGDYTIYPSQLLGTSIIRPEVNGYFGDRKFRLQNFLRNQ